MKHISFITIAILLSVSLTSCHKDKSKSEQVLEFRSELTEQDTTQMLKLCDDCMELLKNRQIDKALGMLHEYDDSLKTVSPLTAEMTKRYEHVFNTFPVYEYTRSYYSFQLEGLNDVKYDIMFAENDKTAKTAFMFNPVRVDGTWYLCVKRADQDIDESKR